MQIEVTNLWLQNSERRIVAKVRFYDELNSPHNSATAEVFVPMVESLDEIKRSAIEKAREFLAEAISSTQSESDQ